MHAFDDWKRDEAELRLFHKTALQLANEHYEAIWNEIGSRPSDGEGPDQGDLFDADTGGMNSYLFELILSDLVLRDAVTLFELYFDTRLRELGIFPKWAEVVAKWPAVASAWRDGVGFDPDTKAVQDIRLLRHNLTHLRGELRSEKDQLRLPTSSLSLRTQAEVDEQVVRHAMRTLAASVRCAERSAVAVSRI